MRRCDRSHRSSATLLSHCGALSVRQVGGIGIGVCGERPAHWFHHRLTPAVAVSDLGPVAAQLVQPLLGESSIVLPAPRERLPDAVQIQQGATALEQALVAAKDLVGTEVDDGTACELNLLVRSQPGLDRHLHYREDRNGCAISPRPPDAHYRGGCGPGALPPACRQGRGRRTSSTP